MFPLFRYVTLPFGVRTKQLEPGRRTCREAMLMAGIFRTGRPLRVRHAGM